LSGCARSGIVVGLMPARFSSGTQVKPLSVLVVEDHDDSRDLACDVIRGAGCIVRGVASAEAAMEAVAERVPDVVVADLLLGCGAAGWTLADTLREDPATARVALIAVSGRVDPEWRIVRAFDAYLRKPVDLDALVTLVQQLGQRSRSALRASRARGHGHTS
jgi:CheY-like chemotaxis protein